MAIEEKRPNILLAIADDASHMSAYDHDFVETPSFDRVAEEGIIFTNAFTNNPKCAPSRASLLTGKHTWQLEKACNHFGIFPSKFEVYPSILEDNGYFSGYTGKGWAPGDWEKGGFSHNPAGPEYNDKCLNSPEGTKIRRKDYSANFEEFISEKSEDCPFCFWYGGHEPHRPYRKGEGKRAGKSKEKVEVPPYLPDNEIVREDLLDYASEIEWFDKHLGLMMEKLEDEGEFENTLIIVTSDNGMPFPRVKGQMYEQDFRMPMALCWKKETEGRRVVEDLVSFVDIAPTFLEAAGLESRSQMVGESLLDLVGSEVSGWIDEGRDVAYMGKERHDVGREGDVGYPVRCIRTKKYLYVRNFKPDRWPAGNPETGFTNCDPSPTKSVILIRHRYGKEGYFQSSFGKRPKEELYNIVKDPECMNNLAEKDEYKELKEELWERLKKELRKTGDPRIFGNGKIFNDYEYQDDMSNSWKAYEEGWFSDDFRYGRFDEDGIDEI